MRRQNMHRLLAPSLTTGKMRKKSRTTCFLSTFRTAKAGQVKFFFFFFKNYCLDCLHDFTIKSSWCACSSDLFYDCSCNNIPNFYTMYHIKTFDVMLSQRPQATRCTVICDSIYSQWNDAQDKIWLTSEMVQGLLL